MPRSKAKCYLLDLGLLKLLCRRDNVDILYDSSNGSNRRNFVNSFVEELRASLAQNAKFAVDNEHDPIGRFPTAFEHLVLLYYMYIPPKYLLLTYSCGNNGLTKCRFME